MFLSMYDTRDRVRVTGGGRLGTALDGGKPGMKRLYKGMGIWGYSTSLIESWILSISASSKAFRILNRGSFQCEKGKKTESVSAGYAD